VLNEGTIRVGDSVYLKEEVGENPAHAVPI
jgi:hypothetical protein